MPGVLSSSYVSATYEQNDISVLPRAIASKAAFENAMAPRRGHGRFHQHRPAHSGRCPGSRR